MSESKNLEHETQSRQEALRDLFDSRGVLRYEIPAQRAICSSPMSVWAAFIGIDAKPLITISDNEPTELLAAHWWRLATEKNLLNASRSCLVSIGDDSGADVWSEVEIPDQGDVFWMFSTRPDEPEFVAMSVNELFACCVSTEEHDLWLLAAERPRIDSPWRLLTV